MEATTDCLWFTAYDSDDVCGLFKDCEEVNAASCPQCVSGEVACSALQCDLPGQCEGTLIHLVTSVNSHKGCLVRQFPVEVI